MKGNEKLALSIANRLKYRRVPHDGWFEETLMHCFGNSFKKLIISALIGFKDADVFIVSHELETDPLIKKELKTRADVFKIAKEYRVQLGHVVMLWMNQAQRSYEDRYITFRNNDEVEL